MKKNITLVPYKRVKLHVTGFKRRNTWFVWFICWYPPEVS